MATFNMLQPTNRLPGLGRPHKNSAALAIAGMRASEPRDLVAERRRWMRDHFATRTTPATTTDAACTVLP
jgi:hypothetical protein